MKNRKKDLDSGIIFSYIVTLAILFLFFSGKASYLYKRFNIYRNNRIYEKLSSFYNIPLNAKTVYKASGYFEMINGNSNSINNPIEPHMVIDGDYFYVYRYDDYSLLFYRDNPNQIYYKNILVWENDEPLVDNLGEIEDTIYNTDCYKIEIIQDKVNVYETYDLNSKVIGKVNSGFESYSLQHGDYYGEYWTCIYLPESDEYGWVYGYDCISVIAK